MRCAVFATNTSSTIIDRHDFDGDILELIEEAEKYALKNIHIGMRLEGLRRVDVPEIPFKAIREALVNAFCHRDWRDPDFVQVAVFKDRLEIRSPGKLYGGLTFDEIRQGNVSSRRNPKIAELLRRIHLVEAWGRGVPLILENAPDASFIEIGGLFITRFKRPSALEAVAQADAKKTHPNTGTETPATTPKTGLKTGPKTSPKTGLEHSDNAKETPRKHQQTLLQLLRQRPTASVPELMQTTGLSTNGVKYHLNQLKRTVDQYRSEGLTDTANALLDEQGGILKSRRSLSRTQQQVRVVRNKIELIQRDRTMTAEEKRRRIDEMLARRNDLVYQAVNKNKANWE